MSKPTARERFEKLKKFIDAPQTDKFTTRVTLPIFEMNFVISLVEAAVKSSAGYCGECGCDVDHSEDVWEELNQRMAEGEGKK